ncbi:hypothetical protein [Limnoglobus roseus]|uniref:Uncharacterized protein n=1 Tax=Limnoglobus roseus TaxID=2598579 RepID=A0A5C1AH90_9BACT|nr:hypothetical protein [Limnoglobus roseus]QEL17613.1 hypothetical protein PX52LOC_04609 [Limnoglobus roseus]
MRRFFLLTAALFTAGCEQPASPNKATTTTTTTTHNTTPSDPDKKTDVHIRTPRVSVDVNREGADKGVDVDVKKNDR